MFPSLSKLDGTRSFLDRPHSDMPLFFGLVGKRRRGRLVSWIDKASLDRIRWLLEITEAEHSCELLLSVKNLRELGTSPFRYIVVSSPIRCQKSSVGVNILSLPAF